MTDNRLCMHLDIVTNISLADEIASGIISTFELADAESVLGTSHEAFPRVDAVYVSGVPVKGIEAATTRLREIFKGDTIGTRDDSPLRFGIASDIGQPVVHIQLGNF